MASWIDEELDGCEFADARLGKRLRAFVSQLSEGIGETIPMACQDWANTKAAYRFLSNDRVQESDILAGHFQSTHEHFQATVGLALVLHDTTSFSFQREDPDWSAILESPVDAKTMQSSASPPHLWRSHAFQPCYHQRRSSVGSLGSKVLDQNGI
jgi:hypothetical protein